MDALLYWGWRTCAWISQRVPLAIGYAVAGFLGDLAYALWRSKREIAKHNFATVLRQSPDKLEVARLARQSFREFAKYVVEIMRFPRLDPDDFPKLVEVQGLQHFEDAIAKGKGVIFVSFHFGNFEMGGARIAGDRPLNVVADDIRSQRLFELLIGHRAKKGILLMGPKGAAKGVLRALRRNELVGLMLDLGPRALAFDTVRVPFFGKDTLFPTVAANLARVSGAPIIVGCVMRRKRQPFLGIIREPIVVERTKQAVEDVQRATARIVAELERLVASRPEQWYIFRPMWPYPETREQAALA